MNICSLVVHTKPNNASTVESRLTALPGVEIHGGNESKLIVTVEDADLHQAADTLNTIQQLEGIVNTSLIYHHGDA